MASFRSSFPSSETVFTPGKKIAVVFSQNWLEYYASSPFYWYMLIDHPMFHVMITGPDRLSVSEIAENLRANDYIGVLLCEGTAPTFTKIDLPKMIVTDDIHRWFRNYQVGYYEAVRADTPLLSCYSLAVPLAEVPLSMSRIARKAMVYCPHFVCDSPCKRPHNIRKPVGIGGGLSELTYPLRARAAVHFSDLDPRPTRSGIRAEFIDILGDYRINITDDVRLGYMVAKYFEIPMSGSLLIAPEPHSEIEKFLLGFDTSNSALLPREKMYDDNFVKKLVGDAIADVSGTEQRAWSGQSLVRRRHTVEARVRYIWSIFQRIESGSWSTTDQFDLFLAAERDKNNKVDREYTAEFKSEIETCDDNSRVCLRVESEYDIGEAIKALGRSPQSVTIVAPTLTQGERTASQLSEVLNDTIISYVIDDRTIIERLAFRHDALVVAKKEGVSIIKDQSKYENFWSHSPDIGHSIRQNALRFWRAVEGRVRRHFGSALIHMTIDENVDHFWGGISFWLWMSRRDCARVRVERIYKDSPIIGLFRLDGYSEFVADEITRSVDPSFGEGQKNDHWQIFYISPDILSCIECESPEKLTELEIKYAEAISHMLRIAFDDVCSSHGKTASM
ncbi:CgeB family protein [Methylorubrum thiocyanatum]|uniref:hypothetical protein n=1 Tax=Methylorubrum thiocyanatum TaxID=47958 RepID=UPI003656635C